MPSRVESLGGNLVKYLVKSLNHVLNVFVLRLRVTTATAIAYIISADTAHMLMFSNFPDGVPPPPSELGIQMLYAGRRIKN